LRSYTDPKELVIGYHAWLTLSDLVSPTPPIAIEVVDKEKNTWKDISYLVED
jgi:hypothetical protein